MASDKTNPSSPSDLLKDEETLVHEKPPAFPPEKTEIPLGASAWNPTGKGTPVGGEQFQTTSTPKEREIKWAKRMSQFFTEEEWKSKMKHIESLNPKEKSRDRQQALQHFKRLLHGQETELAQENVEATWKSLNKYFFHVEFSMSTTTTTREETRQLLEMEEQLEKFREDFKIKKLPDNPFVGPRSTSKVAGENYLKDWIGKMPENKIDENKKELFEMATNNFLTLFRKKIEDVLDTDSAPEGFLDIVQQLDKSYDKIEKIFHNMRQSERDQEIMVFIDQKYKDVKDYMAMLEQMDREELGNDEGIDKEIESILNELNEFANNPEYRPRSELAYLFCSWMSQDLSEEQDDELTSLLQSFGKDRLKLALHLWKSRLCETQSEKHKEISHFLSGLLENWSVPEAGGNGSTWAAHATRFTRGNIPNSSLNEKFSIFLDPGQQKQDGSSENQVSENATLQQLQPITTQRQPTAAPGRSLLAGLRVRQPSGNRPPGTRNRVNTTTPSRSLQQTATNNVDQMGRLADVLERMTASNRNPHSAVKLPPLRLQPFDGNPLEWVNWWPRYEALVHTRQDISDSHKLLYLQQYVTEKAAKELWGAKIETLPYHKAIDLLFEKFADEELLTAMYRDQLKKVHFPKSARDISGMRNFVDTVKKYMNCLREFKMLPHSYSLPTMDFFREKMPMDVLHEIAHQEGRRISKLSLVEFTKALTKYVDLREDTSRFRDHVGVSNLNNGNTTTMVTQTGPNRGETYTLPADFTYYKCLFCGAKGTGGHMMKDCPIVKDPKQRFDIIRELQRCTSCLGTSHRFYECPSKRTCFCRKKHHTSLHDWFARKQSGNQSQDTRSNQQRGAQQTGGNRNQNNNPNSQSQPAGN